MLEQEECENHYTLHIPVLGEVSAFLQSPSKGKYSSTRGLTVAFMPSTVKQDVSRPCSILSVRKTFLKSQSSALLTGKGMEQEGILLFERGFEAPGRTSLSPMTQSLEDWQGSFLLMRIQLSAFLVNA